eukprot:1010865-Pleurochrysis_carterae.AAC.1
MPPAKAFVCARSGTLLPGYERASKRMFEDLHAAFSAGIDSFGSQIGTLVQEQMGAVNDAQSRLVSSAQDKLEAVVSESSQSMRCLLYTSPSPRDGLLS